MTRYIQVDLADFNKEDNKRAYFNDELDKVLVDSLKKHEKSSIVILESPCENYLMKNIESLKYLLNNDFEGVYISFQRPFNNLSFFFKQNSIDTKKLFIIDGVSLSNEEAKADDPRCINVSNDLKSGDLTQAIYKSLSKLKSKKKFVFIDSLSTMAICENCFDADILIDNLINSKHKKELKDVMFLFNVAEDLAQKYQSKYVTVYANEHIHMGHCT